MMPRSSARILATDRQVLHAKAGARRTEFRIKDAKNLVLRVGESGSKTWIFLYASPTSGRRKKIAIGSYPVWRLAKAREEAQSMAVAVRAGFDPLAKRGSLRTADTFEGLAQAYMAEHERRNTRDGRSSASTDEARRLLNADILPKIGEYRAEALTKRQVMDVVERAAERGAYVVADRLLGLIRAIYNWAAATGHLEVNPTLGLKKRVRPRERVLSDDEIRSLLQAIDARSSLSELQLQHHLANGLRQVDISNIIN